jgi:hypothetical protein
VEPKLMFFGLAILFAKGYFGLAILFAKGYFGSTFLEKVEKGGKGGKIIIFT